MKLYDDLSDKAARLFACDCAERILARLSNPDRRVVEAVEVLAEAAWLEFRVGFWLLIGGAVAVLIFNT